MEGTSWKESLQPIKLYKSKKSSSLEWGSVYLAIDTKMGLGFPIMETKHLSL